jgi:hypothetical protein
VKAVAFHPCLGDVARQGIGLRDPGLAGVELGVETGHLRHVGQQRGNGANRRQVVRLVQRGQGREPFELCQRVGRDAHRPRKMLAAMHHPMADGA